MSLRRKSLGLTFAFLASWVWAVPHAGAQSPRRTCDAGEKKLSFGVHFRDKWHGSVSRQAGAKADFSFSDTSMKVVVHNSSGEPSDVRVTLDDMLEMPLLEGEKYSLCFSVQATKSLTALGRFIETVPPKVGQSLQTPETCSFQVDAGYSDQSCQFVARKTTESDEFVFLFGQSAPGTEIEVMDLKLYILK